MSRKLLVYPSLSIVQKFQCQRRVFSSKDKKPDSHSSTAENFNSSQNGVPIDVASESTNKKLWTTAEAISYATRLYTQQINNAYGDLETAVMSRIKESNQRRFRMYFFPMTISVIVVTYFFGSEIRKTLTDQTAGLAKETLENENLKIQTQELATAVIQTILNDVEVTNQAAKFLQQAAGAPESQEALLRLTLHVLQVAAPSNKV
jgi:hypothetical protein